VAGVAQALRTNERGEKVLDSSEFLAQMTPAIQSFASARLAAPQFEGMEQAREAVAEAGKRLRKINVDRETGELVREQQRVVGDWDSEKELMEHARELAQKRLKG